MGGGGNRYTVVGEQGPKYNALKVQTATRGMVIPVLFGTNRLSGNLIWYGDFKDAGFSYTYSWVGRGKGGGGGRSYTFSFDHRYYSLAFAIGICEGPAQLKKIWQNKFVYTGPTYGGDLTLFAGSLGQPKWGYLDAYHPSESLNYPGLAYIAASHFVLMDVDSLPNFNFEIIGTFGSEEIPDANPGDIISYIYGNKTRGLGLDSQYLDVEGIRNWCNASGLLLSPVFSEHTLALDVIKTILEHTFCVAQWHDGSVLRLLPLSDTPVIGNGFGFVPDIAPKYDLTDDHFITDGAEEPILVNRKSPAECFNIIKFECLNRLSDYNIEVIEAMDQASIDIYGQKPGDSIKAWDICDPNVAQYLAQLILQRGLHVRNEYRFRLGWRYCLLEPMDIVTLTDSYLGMDHYPVRIKEIEEDEEYNNFIIAEDFPEGIGQAARHSTQENLGYLTDFNIDPGNVNTPIIFLAPSVLWAVPDKPEIWIALSGSEEFWGGCDVHVSHDDATYDYCGTLIGKSRHGFLSAPLPIGSDPDWTNVCSVDLSISNGGMISGTQIDADNFVTLCMILTGGMEAISYQDAVLTAENKYNLGYLRRGAKGTSNVAHPTGSQFVRLDEHILKLPFDSLWLHKVVYFKFCSINLWEANKQDLADVDAYEFVIQSPISDLMIGTDSVVLASTPGISDSGHGTDSISVSK